MTTYEIAEYFRAIVQEPDNTFLTDAQVAVFLKQAYREFRAIVTMADNDFFTNRVTIAPGSDSYDLASGAVSIMGASPTDPRMSRLLMIAETNSDITDDYIYKAVSNRRALWSSVTPSYFLQGTKLYFSENAPPSLDITYIPVDSIDWANNLTSPGIFVDNLDEFHDIVALFAARRYHVMDATTSSRLDAELGIRKDQLEEFLVRGRSMDADHISETEYYDQWGE